MKRILLILLISQTVGLIGFRLSLGSELLKIGNLVEHFWSHQSETEGLSVYDFFVLHYFSETIIDEDYTEDMALPFKSQTSPPNVTLTKCCVEPFFPTLENVSNIVGFSPSTDDKSVYSTDLLNIWQPPKA